MAPEQHRGQPCDARSDQFSFCVTFYQALYGERPFRGDTYEQLRDHILVGAVAAAPAGTRVPSWIRDLVVRGLAVDPAARWPSMTALLAALARDPAARRADVARALLVALVALVSGVGLARAIDHAATGSGICDDGAASLHGVWDAQRRDEIAAAFAATGTAYGERAFRAVAGVFDAYAGAWSSMHREACEATRVRGQQSAELFDLRMACLENRLREWKARVDVLAHADRATVENALASAQSLGRIDACADAAALRAAVPLPADPAVRARLETLRGHIADAQATLEAGRYAEARRSVPAIVEEARAVAYRPAEAEALYLQAQLAEHTDEYTAAAASLKELAAVAESVHADELAAIGAIDQVWIVGPRLGRLAEARELARGAAAKIERLGGNPALRARLEAHLGSLELADGHTSDARRHSERALALRRRVLRPDDPRIAETVRVLGDIAVMESRPDEAIARYQEALAQLEATVGPAHPATAWVVSNLAAALRGKGQLGDALAAYDRARALVLRNSGRDDAILATIALNVGMIDVELGRLDDARAQYDQALAIWTHALGPAHANVGSVHMLLGQLAVRRHRLEEAARELTQAQQIWTASFGAAHPSVAEALVGFGDLGLARGAPGEALASYRRALQIQEKAMGPTYPDLATPLTGMGLAELARAAPLRALPPLERALALRQATAGDPVELARTRFALARALRASRRDPERVRTLAQAARAAYAGRAGQESMVAEIDAFVRAPLP
jgi:tetratricopeptide (TPR) repeat protein